MGIEEYGGSCPHCQKAMLQKWESSGGFMFDACVWCGFADGTQWIEDEKGTYVGNSTPEYIWDAILEIHNVERREELIPKLNLEPYATEETSDFWPSIFDYAKLHTVQEQRTDHPQQP